MILAAASRAYPRECCGLLVGGDTGDGWRVLAAHEAANLANDPASHFLIDPQTQFDLLRGLRGSDRRIIGCFHSHPNGLPQPSETDRASAFEDDFVWLIAAGARTDAMALHGFHFRETAGFAPIALAEDAA